MRGVIVHVVVRLTARERRLADPRPFSQSSSRLAVPQEVGGQRRDAETERGLVLTVRSGVGHDRSVRGEVGDEVGVGRTGGVRGRR